MAKALYDLDITEWMKRFPLDAYDPEIIQSRHGPAEICYIEQIRTRYEECHTQVQMIPTDVFVLGHGPAPLRDMTQVGGVPYRPVGIPWPKSTESGEPLKFFAQYRCSESKDILGNLPGDILLLFFQDTSAWPFDQFSAPPVFEWYSLGIDDLIESNDVPYDLSSSFLPECYGLRYRTYDLVADVVIDDIEAILPEDFIYWYEDDPEESKHIEARARLFTLDKLKLGGVPFWRFPHATEMEGVIPGRFLASFPQICYYNDGKYPWVNVKSEDLIHEEQKKSLYWLGEGIVHLFLDDEGTVHPCYEMYGLVDPPFE